MKKIWKNATLCIIYITIILIAFSVGKATRNKNSSANKLPLATAPMTINKKNNSEYVVVVPEQKYHYVSENGNFTKEEVIIPALKLPRYTKSREMIYKDYSKAALHLLFSPAGNPYEGTTPEVIEALNLQPDDIFVDVGAGCGFYALYAADRVKEYYASDLGPSSLDFIKWKVKLAENGFFNAKFPGNHFPAKKYDNISTHINKEDDAMITEKKADIILLQNVHYFTTRGEDSTTKNNFTKSLKKGLKKNGRIVIVEGIPQDTETLFTIEENIKYFESFGFKVRVRIYKELGQYILTLTNP